ncbi:unnamed protein product [Adineta ricciae]|uniref:F-box domain-containing protein n=1 Tax=Adineta ricciae TaxID=249248 RepID=A0A814JKK0_ADIRI|nr:unnamed protein product [Adineta ricciae]CAF1375048.1 unnamed protein product [Adineta ricciae]
MKENVTSILDLPNEILLHICRYLSQSHILYAFYTPLTPEYRFHSIISDYYETIRLDQQTYYEFIHLRSLFLFSELPLRPKSLILSNRHVNILIERFSDSEFFSNDVLQSIFSNLTHLTILNYSVTDLHFIDDHIKELKQLEYFHVNIIPFDTQSDAYMLSKCNRSFTEIIYRVKMPLLHTFRCETPNGLILQKDTIDDLYILLDGIAPNAETMLIKLYQPRILTRPRPNGRLSCPRLTQFSFLECSIGLSIDDLKSIFVYMKNLNQLTLSIRNTPDPTFCDGSIVESILNKYLPSLRQFHYTMTHQISDQTVPKDFLRWPMVIKTYGERIHIYSLPWPSNKYDRREIPAESEATDLNHSKYKKHLLVTNNTQFHQFNKYFAHVDQITTSLPLHIQLPWHVTKLILSANTSINVWISNAVVQPSIRHFIAKSNVIDEKQMLILIQKFPRVKYLELLLSSDMIPFIRCWNILFNRKDNTRKYCSDWPNLIIFSTAVSREQRYFLTATSYSFEWFIRNTDLKYYTDRFFFDENNSKITIWF